MLLMSEVESYSFYCEDLRWESTGSPMLLGIMSPTFAAVSYPITFTKLNVVTFFKASLSVKEFRADLIVKKISNGSEEILGEFSSNFDQESEEASHFQWVSIAVLPLEALELDEFDTLCATVSIGDLESTTYLTADKRHNVDDADADAKIFGHPKPLP
jgi:hypothetical protein